MQKVSDFPESVQIMNGKLGAVHYLAWNYRYWCPKNGCQKRAKWVYVSPIGLAAWITEKLRSWSDCDGDVETRFSKDQILTLISIYWFTRTIGTSVRYYYENGLGSSRARNRPSPWLRDVQVPQGFAQFVGIPSRTGPPRSFIAEPNENVTHWSVYDTGGHFPAIEEPALLVRDLRTFFSRLRSEA